VAFEEFAKGRSIVRGGQIPELTVGHPFELVAHKYIMSGTPT